MIKFILLVAFALFLTTVLPVWMVIVGLILLLGLSSNSSAKEEKKQ
jgi:hypothetical protein